MFVCFVFVFCLFNYVLACVFCSRVLFIWWFVCAFCVCMSVWLFVCFVVCSLFGCFVGLCGFLCWLTSGPICVFVLLFGVLFVFCVCVFVWSICFCVLFVILFVGVACSSGFLFCLCVRLMSVVF